MMQHFDAITLKHLASGLSEVLCGSKINKIQHPSKHELLIGFWGGPSRFSSQKRLYINLNPTGPCLFIDEKKRLDNLIDVDYPKPTGFCMQLRKHLVGGNIKKVIAVPGDRIVEFSLRNINELGNEVHLKIILEFFGQYATMVVCQESDSKIITVSPGTSNTIVENRGLVADYPYVVPSPPEGKPLFSVLTQAEFLKMTEGLKEPVELEEVIQQNTWGIHRSLIQKLLKITTQPEVLYDLLNRLDSGQDLAPFISQDGKYYQLIGVDTEDNCFDSVHAMVATYYYDQWRRRRFDQKQKRLLGALSKKQKSLQAQLDVRSPADAIEVEALQNKGALIYTAMSCGDLPEHPDSKTIEVDDLTSGEVVTIEINPEFGWSENAQRYYKKARKEQNKLASFGAHQKVLVTQMDYYTQLETMVRQADSMEALDDVFLDLMDVGLMKGKKANAKKEKSDLSGIISHTSGDGFTIYIGRSGSGNAQLVGKLARSDDIWLHVHEMPGSHVLIKAEKKEVPDETLLEAAQLAAYHSVARESKKVSVIYTDIRHVRKIPDSYPGHVTYKNEQTIVVTPREAI